MGRMKELRQQLIDEICSEYAEEKTDRDHALFELWRLGLSCLEADALLWRRKTGRY